MKKLISIIASPVLMLVLLLVFGFSIALATFIEHKQSTEMAWQLVYQAKWFELLLVLGMLNLTLSIVTRKLYKAEKLSVFVFHIAFVLIILGAGATRYLGIDGTMVINEGESSNSFTTGTIVHQIPFSLHLIDFKIEYYRGSRNPSGYQSTVFLHDKEKGIAEERKIFMNNILKHRGYRFYQSSYTKDEKGTILAVKYDTAGTAITYLGYFLMIMGIVFSLINRNSRFFKLLTQKASILLIFLVALTQNSHGNGMDSLPVIPLHHAQKFGELIVHDEQGRTKPLNTLMEDVFRKVYRGNEYNGQKAVQVLLGMFVYPEIWQKEPLVYAGKKVPELIDIENKRVSLRECWVGQGYFISSMEAARAYRLPPAKRSKAQNDLIRFDERLNILYQWFGGYMLNIFPNPNDSISAWYNPINVAGNIHTSDSVLLYNGLFVYFAEIRNALESGNWHTADELLAAFHSYQYAEGKDLPAPARIKLEIGYYKAHIFKRLSYVYLILGGILLFTSLLQMFYKQLQVSTIQRSLVVLIGLALVLHTFGLAARWYIAGHAPWSNAYETMIFIAWSCVLAGVLFAGKDKTATAVAAIVAWIYLFAGHMSWMDPQITNLVPVLKSIWLVIHVAVITSSYGFLGVGSIIALVNLFVMVFQNRSNANRLQQHIDKLTRIVDLSLIIGLYLLTTGTFLGAVWANVSWGRYWAWDPKETWALITIIVYALVLHMRLVPVLKKTLLFNTLALLAYASVLMTFFGVNYYLSGLHSYATGDPAPLPKGILYAGGFIVILVAAAFLNQLVLKPEKRTPQ